MVLIQRAFKVIFLVFILLQTSCEDMNFYNCEDCLSIEPATCILDIVLTSTSAANYDYHVIVYQGKVEDNIVIDDRYTSNNFEFEVSLNKEYSVKASMVRGGVTYVSINSVTPMVSYQEDYCETACYFVIDNKVDMKIKYF